MANSKKTQAVDGDTRGLTTPDGIYLGTVWVERPTRLTRAEAEEHTDAYLELGHEVYVDEQFRDSVVDKLQDNAIAFAFESPVEPIEVPEQTIKGVVIPGYTYMPPAEQTVILAEDFYRQL